MPRRNPTRPHGGSTSRRDLLVIATVLAGLFGLGLATDAFDRAERWIGGQQYLDEFLGALLLLLCGVTTLAVLRWRLAAAETRRRLDSDRRLRTLVEQVPTVIYTWDATRPAGEAAPMFISPQVETLLGYPVEQWRSDPDLWVRTIHPDDRDRVIEESDRADRAGAPFQAEYRSIHRDGSVVWIHDESNIVEWDELGRPAIAQGVMYDITRRKEAEQRLRSAEARFRTLVEQIPAITYLEDAETGAQLYVSPRVEEMFGYTPEEWRAEPDLWRRCIHPDDLERVAAENDAGTDAWNGDYRTYARDGRLLWVHNETVLIRDEHGRPAYWQGVVFDITERKEAEDRIRAAEERFRSLVEQLPVAVYTDAVDEHSSALYISPQYERVTGYPPAERLADPGLWLRMLHDEDRETVQEESLRTNATGDPFDMEYRIVTKSGRVAWVHDHAILVREASGRRVWQGVLTDITQRRNAEHQLHEAETRYRTLIETIPAATYIDTVTDLSQGIYVSPQIETIYGYTPEEWIEHSELWERGLHPDDHDRVVAAVERHLAEGVSYEAEYRYRHRNGRWVWVRDQAVLVRDEAGVPLLSQGVVFDVTELKEAELQLREAEERFRAIVEHVPAAIYLDKTDASMESIYVSPQILEIAGVTPEEWIADPELWLKIMHPDDREEIVASYQECVTTGSPWSAEYRIQTRDGRAIWVHDETTFVRDRDGDPLFLQGVIFDVTERKLAEQALRESEQREREAAERLRALDEMKNTFLAAVSHELRSPLTSILGLAITLERSPELLQADRADLLQRLAENARKLDRLLKDLLDIDRLNRGIVGPQHRETDLAALATGTLESLEALADRRVEVVAEPVSISVDAPKVERIVENLLMNAARHTPPDRRIWLMVEAVEGGAMIAVEDEGPGVPHDMRDEIFEPFRQGPTASPHAPGTGIGLSLVSRFAELHGGRAWVEDRVGGGASFRVFLPASTEPAAEPNGHGRGDLIPSAPPDGVATGERSAVTARGSPE